MEYYDAVSFTWMDTTVVMWTLRRPVLSAVVFRTAAGTPSRSACRSSPRSRRRASACATAPSEKGEDGDEKEDEWW